MNDRLDTLLEQMRSIEKELKQEIQRKEGLFLYEIRKGKVRFEKEAEERNKKLAKQWRRTLLDSKPLIVLTTPLIWLCLIPFLLLDATTTVFQAVCFPIYGIPKIRRKDYIVMDRHHLAYLNLIEKMNCLYCGYANGLMAYICEMASRVEQYWCPIKHAFRLKSMHSRYRHFFDYGDAESYRKRIEETRRQFDDLKKQDPQE